MSTALRLAHGAFGRVALLDMDRLLVRHAHPHCHVLLKVEGADTQFSFSIRDRLAPLTDRTAVLVNAWEPHAYVHNPRRTRTIILALYIEPGWLRCFRPNWAASGAPGFLDYPTGEISARIRRLKNDLAAAMVHAPDAAPEHEALLTELMVALIKHFTSWRSVSTSLASFARHGITNHRVRRAIEMMRSEPGAVTDMSGLARAAGLSRAGLFRAFEASVRAPPRLFLNMIRMEMAVAASVEGQTRSRPSRTGSVSARRRTSPGSSETMPAPRPARSGASQAWREQPDILRRLGIEPGCVT